jgi:hypothetical protein
MRIVLLLVAAILASAGAATPSLAYYEGPWCAHRQMGGGFVENNCGMMSYEQCRANIFATGGAWCTQNPRYVGPVGPPRKAKKKRR